MIIGSQKPIEEIWNMVKDFKKVLVFGCNTCVAICHAAERKRPRRSRPHQDEGVAGRRVHGREPHGCHAPLRAGVLRAGDGRGEKYDLVLSTACGVGVNFLSDRTGTVPVYPGINTSFYGAVEAPGDSRNSARDAGTASCI